MSVLYFFHVFNHYVNSATDNKTFVV